MENRLGLPIIYNQLSYFHFINDNITVMLIKTIDCYDLSQESLTYTKLVIEILMGVVEKSQNSEFRKNNNEIDGVKILVKFLFFKILRINSIVYFIEDRKVRDFKDLCYVTLEKLYQMVKK